MGDLMIPLKKNDVSLIDSFNEEQIQLIKDMYRASNLTEAEFKTFLYQSLKTRLDPLRKQIYAVKFRGKMTTITGIDGFRATAHRTSLYAGKDETAFLYDGDKLRRATVTVYRLVGGHRCPFTASASWDEYYPSDADKRFMWNKFPEVMLAKCAEAQALRMGFPEEFSGIHADAEMDQAYDSKASEVRRTVEASFEKDVTSSELKLSDFKIEFGRLSQKYETLGQVPTDELQAYVDDIEKSLAKSKKQLDGAQKDLLMAAKAYLEESSGEWSNK